MSSKSLWANWFQGTLLNPLMQWHFSPKRGSSTLKRILALSTGELSSKLKEGKKWSVGNGSNINGMMNGFWIAWLQISFLTWPYLLVLWSPSLWVLIDGEFLKNCLSQYKFFVLYHLNDFHLPHLICCDKLVCNNIPSGDLFLRKAWELVRTRSVLHRWVTLTWNKLLKSHVSVFAWKFFNKNVTTICTGSISWSAFGHLLPSLSATWWISYWVILPLILHKIDLA